MKLMGFLGNIVFGLIGLAMAAFYLGIFSFWSNDLDGPGTGEKVLVGALAALWLFGAVKRFRNGFKSVMPPPRQERRSHEDVQVDAPSNFDAEAALERYLASRPSAATPQPAAPAGRGFGRRGL